MNSKDEMLEEYDFSNGISGKESVNIVKIDNNIIKFFPDKKIANEAHNS